MKQLDTAVAACRDVDPELFFPLGKSGPALLQVEAAKAVCHRCLIREECGQYAVASGQEFGIWGGLDEDERRHALRRGNHAQVQQAQSRYEKALSLYVRGVSVREIAWELEVTVQTVEKYLQTAGRSS